MHMRNTLKTMMAAATALSAAATSAHSGGLSDAIVESEPEPIVMDDASRSGVPGWVVPVVVLGLLGAAVASSSGDDNDDGDTGSAGGELDPK